MLTCTCSFVTYVFLAWRIPPLTPVGTGGVLSIFRSPVDLAAMLCAETALATADLLPPGSARIHPERRRWSPQTLTQACLYATLSQAAQQELREFVERSGAGQALETITVGPDDLPAFSDDVERIREELDYGRGLVVVRAIPGLSYRQREIVSWALTLLLGDPLVQSASGDRVVHVYDRDRTKRMEDGARYHQTRQGGSLHTDNVNSPEPWEYLVFSCLEPALVGGQSIVVNGYGILDYLRERVPAALDVLSEPFWWEYRGIADKLYRAPIIAFDAQGNPFFRYLRIYMESAHRKAGQPLTELQMWALDVLDAVLERSELQLRLDLSGGETLITFDSQMLHGRTTFADHFDAVGVDQADAQMDSRPARRTFDRTWVRKRQTIA